MRADWGCQSFDIFWEIFAVFGFWDHIPSEDRFAFVVGQDWTQEEERPGLLFKQVRFLFDGEDVALGSFIRS
ncbi:MAG: hypothetical protein CMH80_03825 [Nitrospinae bacterium]|nr:hypothetical protein [Nitrospinota bacterium]